jgi:hypothetical protein
MFPLEELTKISSDMDTNIFCNLDLYHPVESHGCLRETISEDGASKLIRNVSVLPAYTSSHVTAVRSSQPALQMSLW